MPIFDYQCNVCSQCFEVIRSYSEVDGSNPVCVYCGANQTTRKLGNVVVLTGINGKNQTNRGKHTCGSCSPRSSTSCSGCGK